MLLGVHEQYQSDAATTPEATKTRYPLTAITREFKAGVIKPQNLLPAMKTLCEKVWTAGLVVNVSFKLSPAEVFNGQWRPFIDQLGHYIVDQGRMAQTVITVWHEPEDDTRDSFPNGVKSGKVISFKTGEEFVRYFNTVHGWLKEVNPNIVTSHAALGYGYRPNVGGPGDKSAWVGNPEQWVTYADVQAIDIYSGRSFPLDMNLGTSEAFKRWKGSRPLGSRWGVSERGWTAPVGFHEKRAESIKAEFEWLASLPREERPAFYIVWLTEGVENDPNLRPDTLMVEAVNTGFTLASGAPTTPPVVEEPKEPELRECPLCHGSGKVPADSNITITTTVSVVPHGR